MYNPCCHESAENAGFRLCPECGTRLIRCPACGGLLTELGYCPSCVQPKLEMKRGMMLREGGFCTVPVMLSNRGPQAFRVRRLAYMVPGHQDETELRAGFRLATGEIEEFSLSIMLDRAGEYAVELDAELDWEHGARVGLRFKAPGVVVARMRDSLINQGGTGNMAYISGATSEVIANQLRDVDSSAVAYSLIEARALNVLDLPDYGASAGAVTLATELQLPDLYAMSKGSDGDDKRLYPDPAAGIILGRDNPGPGKPNHGVLRIPGRVTNSGDLTKSLSSSHWRLFPHEGMWWLEVLGRRPSLVADKLLERGSKVVLHEGTIISPLADRPTALRLKLTHEEANGGQIRRSRLSLL